MYSKQNTRANAGRLLDRVNTILRTEYGRTDRQTDDTIVYQGLDLKRSAEIEIMKPNSISH